MLLIAAAFAGVACTAATLAAVHEENEVVQLAQQLAASSVQVSWVLPGQAGTAKAAVCCA